MYVDIHDGMRPMHLWTCGVNRVGIVVLRCVESVFTG